MFQVESRFRLFCLLLDALNAKGYFEADSPFCGIDIIEDAFPLFSRCFDVTDFECSRIAKGLPLLPLYALAKPAVIKKGSAIVGFPGKSDGGRELVYYEGDVYGVFKNNFDEKAFHAADRMVGDYPTIAKVSLPREELVLMGAFDYVSRTTIIDDIELAGRWLGDVNE